MINAKRRNLASLLPADFGPDKMVAMVLGSFRKNPDLFGCTHESILACMFECAKLQLAPDTPQGMCHLIPYKGVCTFQLGYRGAVVLAARNNDLSHVKSINVYDCDALEIDAFTGPKLLIEPYRPQDAEYRGTLAFAVWKDQTRDKAWAWVPAHGPDGMDAIEAHALNCLVSELPKLRSQLLSKGSTKPWIKWPDAQRQKTAIKRLCKRDLPAWDESVSRAIMLDDRAESRVHQITKELGGTFDAVPSDDDDDADGIDTTTSSLPPDIDEQINTLAAELVNAGHDATAIDAAISTAESSKAALEQLKTIKASHS